MTIGDGESGIGTGTVIGTGIGGIGVIGLRGREEGHVGCCVLLCRRRRRDGRASLELPVR